MWSIMISKMINFTFSVSESSVWNTLPGLSVDTLNAV